MEKDPFKEYLRESEPDKAHKSYAWSTAIGLQAVDGLKPSKYLIDTAIQNIEGKITMKEAQSLIDSYYEERPVHFEHLKRIMTKLKLMLNPQKTKIVDMNKESFDFLGFCFRKFGKTKSGRKLPYMMPSKKAIKKVKDAVRVITCRKSAYEGLEQKVEKLNPLIRGWRNYFQHGNSTKRFKQLDEFVWMKLWRRVYYRRKQKKYREHVLYGFRKWYATSGIEYFYYLNKKRYVAVV